MNSPRNPFIDIFNRRGFCRSISALVAGAVIARLPAAQASEWVAIKDAEYLIVNGWVLTREDVATMELPPDVIRLQ
jgi:hypothetical protein